MRALYKIKKKDCCFSNYIDNFHKMSKVLRVATRSGNQEKSGKILKNDKSQEKSVNLIK